MSCDPWQALIELEGATGCAVRMQLGMPDNWQYLGAAYALITFMLMVALVVAQVGRR
jgi:hypothetical protein